MSLSSSPSSPSATAAAGGGASSLLPAAAASLRDEFLPLLRTLEAHGSLAGSGYVLELIFALVRFDAFLKREERHLFVRAFNAIIAGVMAELTRVQRLLGQLEENREYLAGLVQRCAVLEGMADAKARIEGERQEAFLAAHQQQQQQQESSLRGKATGGQNSAAVSVAAVLPSPDWQDSFTGSAANMTTTVHTPAAPLNFSFAGAPTPTTATAFSTNASFTDRHASMQEALRSSMRKHIEHGLTRSSWTVPAGMAELATAASHLSVNNYRNNSSSTANAVMSGCPSRNDSFFVTPVVVAITAAQSGNNSSSAANANWDDPRRMRRGLSGSSQPPLLPAGTGHGMAYQQQTTTEPTATAAPLYGAGSVGSLNLPYYPVPPPLQPPGHPHQQRRLLCPLGDDPSEYSGHNDNSNAGRSSSPTDAHTAASVTVEGLWEASLWRLLNGAEAPADVELLYGLLSSHKKVVVPPPQTATAITSSGVGPTAASGAHGGGNVPPPSSSSSAKRGHSAGSATTTNINSHHEVHKRDKVSQQHRHTHSHHHSPLLCNGPGGTIQSPTPHTSTAVVAAVGHGTAEPARWHMWFTIVVVLSVFTEGFMLGGSTPEEEAAAAAQESEQGREEDEGAEAAAAAGEVTVPGSAAVSLCSSFDSTASSNTRRRRRRSGSGGGNGIASAVAAPDGNNDNGGSGAAGPPSALREPSAEALALLQTVYCPSLRNFRVGVDNVIAAAPALAAKAAATAAAAVVTRAATAVSQVGSPLGGIPQQQQHSSPVTGCDSLSPYDASANEFLSNGSMALAPGTAGALLFGGGSFAGAGPISCPGSPGGGHHQSLSPDAFLFPTETGLLSEGGGAALRPVDLLIHALVTALEVQLEVIADAQAAERAAADGGGGGGGELTEEGEETETETDGAATMDTEAHSQQRQRQLSSGGGGSDDGSSTAGGGGGMRQRGKLTASRFSLTNLSFASTQSGTATLLVSPQTAELGAATLEALLARSVSSAMAAGPAAVAAAAAVRAAAATTTTSNNSMASPPSVAALDAALESGGGGGGGDTDRETPSLSATVTDTRRPSRAGGEEYDEQQQEQEQEEERQQQQQRLFLSLPAIMRTELQHMLTGVCASLDTVSSMVGQLKNEAALLIFRVASTVLDWLIPAVYLVDGRAALFYRAWVCDLYALMFKQGILPRFTAILDQDGRADSDDDDDDGGGGGGSSNNEEDGGATTAIGNDTDGPASRLEPPAVAALAAKRADKGKEKEKEKGRRPGGKLRPDSGGKKVKGGGPALRPPPVTLPDAAEADPRKATTTSTTVISAATASSPLVRSPTTAVVHADPFALVVPGCNVQIITASESLVLACEAIPAAPPPPASPSDGPKQQQQRGQPLFILSRNTSGVPRRVKHTSSNAVTNTSEDNIAGIASSSAATTASTAVRLVSDITFRRVEAGLSPQLQVREQLRQEEQRRQEGRPHHNHNSSHPHSHSHHHAPSGLTLGALRLLTGDTAGVRAAQALLDEGTYVPPPRRFIVSRLVAAALRGMDPGAVRSLLAPFNSRRNLDVNNVNFHNAGGGGGGGGAVATVSDRNASHGFGAAAGSRGRSAAGDGTTSTRSASADDSSRFRPALSRSSIESTHVSPVSRGPPVFGVTPPRAVDATTTATANNNAAAGNVGGDKKGGARSKSAVHATTDAAAAAGTVAAAASSSVYLEGPALVHHHRFRYPVVSGSADLADLYEGTLSEAEVLLSPHDPLRAALVQSVADFYLAQSGDPARALALLDDYLDDVGEEAVRMPALLPVAVLGGPITSTTATTTLTTTATTTAVGGGASLPAPSQGAGSAFSVTSVRRPQQQQQVPPSARPMTPPMPPPGGVAHHQPHHQQQQAPSLPLVPMVIPSWASAEEQEQFVHVLGLLRSTQEMLRARLAA